MSDKEPTGWDMSHGLLVAVLMRLGGSIELDLDDVQPDTMGNPAGELYSVAMTPLDAARVRLSVIPRTDAEGS